MRGTGRHRRIAQRAPTGLYADPLLGRVGQEGGFFTRQIGLRDGLIVQAQWSVQSVDTQETTLYLELEIIRPMFPSPQRLISTLPGNGRFSSEMNPLNIARAQAVTKAVSAGGRADVFALVEFAPAATPAPVTLDLRLRLRVVENQNEGDPSKVGPVVNDGEFSQNGIFKIVRGTPAEQNIQVQSALPFLSAGDRSGGLHALKPLSGSVLGVLPPGVGA